VFPASSCYGSSLAPQLAFPSGYIVSESSKRVLSTTLDPAYCYHNCKHGEFCVGFTFSFISCACVCVCLCPSHNEPDIHC